MKREDEIKKSVNDILDSSEDRDKVLDQINITFYMVLRNLINIWKDTQIGHINDCRKNQIIFSDIMWNLHGKLKEYEHQKEEESEERKAKEKKWEESVGI